MIERTYMYASKLRLVLGGVLIISSLFLLYFMISSFVNKEAVFALGTTSKSTEERFANSNVVSTGMSKMASSVAQTVGSVENTLSSSLGGAAKSITRTGKSVGLAVFQGSKFVARHVYSGLVFTATAAGNGLVFVVKLPSEIIGFAANTLSDSTITRPTDNSEVPIIDTQLAALYANYPILTEEELAAQTVPQDAQDQMWPINGRITTLFGVPHKPYQERHTGLDISSGNYSGVIPIKPFRAGKVLDAVKSRSGLGNHVVIDHGNGITSVYAHLYSISVQRDQQVDRNTVLGLEGSTGTSTGTHLHFEIRLNGQPVDPQQYISGHP